MSGGETNSSITRVWPVFQELLRRDITGQTWMRPLLQLASHSPTARDRLVEALVPLKASVKEVRRYRGEAIRQYRPDGMDLPQCFEASVSPPAAFLRWLVANPSKLRWTAKAHDDLSDAAAKRRALSGERGAAAQRETMQEALEAIETYGAVGSGRQWWAFEGFTSVDCLLESGTALLFVEGKRNDVVSETTDWYTGRNQVIRNLEVAEVRAAGRAFGVIVISETGEDPISAATFAAGLPHLPEPERARLRQHYVGCVSWRAVCHAVGIQYERLPSTVAEALAG